MHKEYIMPYGMWNNFYDTYRQKIGFSESVSAVEQVDAWIESEFGLKENSVPQVTKVSLHYSYIIVDEKKYMEFLLKHG